MTPNKVIIYKPYGNYESIAQQLLEAGHGPRRIFIPAENRSGARTVAVSMQDKFSRMSHDVMCHEFEFPYTERTVPFFAEKVRLHWQHSEFWTGPSIVVCDRLAELMARQFTKAADHIIQQGTAVVLEQNAPTHANPQAFHLVNAYQ